MPFSSVDIPTMDLHNQGSPSSLPDPHFTYKLEYSVLLSSTKCDDKPQHHHYWGHCIIIHTRSVKNPRQCVENKVQVEQEIGELMSYKQVGTSCLLTIDTWASSAPCIIKGQAHLHKEATKWFINQGSSQHQSQQFVNRGRWLLLEAYLDTNISAKIQKLQIE